MIMPGTFFIMPGTLKLKYIPDVYKVFNILLKLII